MPLLAAELLLDAQTVTSFADALLEHGAISVDVTDAQSGSPDEQAIYLEPGEDVTLAWGDNRLVGLFNDGTDVIVALEAAANATGLPALPAYRIYQVADKDWVQLTQNQFDPIAVSRRLWIVPSWHALPDPAAINIVMDPGLAFGTGSHPTTFLCLDWLDRNLQPGQSVIDYGCGSGILAIAAAKLGALKVTGIDIDAQALQASRRNALQNGVTIEFADADAHHVAPAEVVISNILSGPLQVLAPLLSRLTCSCGRLVLSGILEAQAEQVMAVYRAWFEMLPVVSRDGWVRLEGVRLRT